MDGIFSERIIKVKFAYFLKGRRFEIFKTKFNFLDCQSEFNVNFEFFKSFYNNKL